MALFSRSLLSKNMHILNTKPDMAFHSSEWIGSNRAWQRVRNFPDPIWLRNVPTPRRDGKKPSFLPSFRPSFFPSREATREQLYGGSKARQIARNEERAATAAAAANKSGVEK